MYNFKLPNLYMLTENMAKSYNSIIFKSKVSGLNRQEKEPDVLRMPTIRTQF